MERPGHRSSDNLNTSTTANAQQQQRASITIDQLPRLPDGKIELPRRYDEAPMDALVELIADMLQRLIVHNDQIPLSPEALTRFHSRSPPAISVLDYLRRIVRYANVEVRHICFRCPTFVSYLPSITAYVLAHHSSLHRSNMRSNAAIHIVLSHGTPLRHSGCRSRLQGIMRRILFKRTLRSCRWHTCRRAQRP